MKRAAWILVFLFVASLPAVTTRLYASDEIEYYSFLRSLWFDHDLSFDNEYRYFLDHGVARGIGFRETFVDAVTPTGLRPNFGTIGSALLWVPMYAVADAGVRTARALGATVAADGYSRPYLAAMAYGSALYGFLALLIAAEVAQRFAPSGVLAAALVWAGTPLPFYMYLAPGMAHACSAFAVALFVLAWLRVRRRWSARGLAALGALAALMTMVREQDVFFVAGVAVDYAWTMAAGETARVPVGERLRGLAAGAAAFAVAYLPQAWAYLVLNGRLGPAKVVSDKMQWYAPHAGQVLFSPEHGLFIWTPLALLAVAGLAILAARPAATPEAADRRQALVALGVMFLAQVYISGSVGTWTVAGSFGQRRFVGTTIVLVVGLAGLIRAARGWRRGLGAAALVLAVWWNLGLMVQFGAGMMDRQRLTLRDNAYNTFVRVPRELPVLVYRYFFNRSSFYRP
ncbi:MAG TPA: hypothetical protein VL309_04820 [Vicinamibacterales bacterium]|jgi:hypothetical protein|nr:hypothetical protein [Vicinamibacterales bacterium]